MRTFWPILAALSSVGMSGPARADPWARALAERTGVQLDESLSRAAARHARAIAEQTDGSLPDDIRGAVALEGLADAQLATFAALGDEAALPARAEAFAAARARALGGSHLGVGRASRGGSAALVVVWSRRLVDLPPLVAQAPRRTKTLAGRLLGGDRPRAYVTLPSGEVVEVEVERTGRRIAFAVPLERARGRYDVEVVVETGRGPEIAALWRFAVEVPAPAATAVPELADDRALRDAILTLRRGLGHADALAPSVALDAAARGHAQRVCADEVAAHVLDGVGPDLRARRAGWAGPIAENIAIAPSIGAAHAELLASPSHRRNLLLPEAHALGLGVAKARDRVCVVELLGLSDSRPTTWR